MKPNVAALRTNIAVVPLNIWRIRRRRFRYMRSVLLLNLLPKSANAKSHFSKRKRQLTKLRQQTPSGEQKRQSKRGTAPTNYLLCEQMTPRLLRGEGQF